MQYKLEHEPEGDLEALSGYQPGGYLPIHIGAYFGPDARFQVFEKLGAGGHSTVWLCRDRVRQKWKAIKILSARTSLETSELKIAHYLKERDDWEANHICLPDEHFWEDGPSGRHLCLVLPLHGSDLYLIWYDYANRPATLRTICLQIGEALRYLHGRGVCHGDFRSTNIMLKLKDMEDLSEEEVRSMIPKSERIRVIPSNPEGWQEGQALPKPPPHIPSFVYTRTSIIPRAEHLGFGSVVTDFGEAFKASNPPSATKIPSTYAAPEVLFGGKDHKVGYPSDIWALGATFCEIRNIVPPFQEGKRSPTCIVRRLEEILGPLPKLFRSNFITGCAYQSPKAMPHASEIPLSMLLTWTEDELAHHKHELRRRFGCDNWLEKTVRQKHNFFYYDADQVEKAIGVRIPTKEADCLLDLLTKIFRYSPDDRIAIDEVMAHPWCTGAFEHEVLTEEDKVPLGDDSWPEIPEEVPQYEPGWRHKYNAIVRPVRDHSQQKKETATQPTTCPEDIDDHDPTMPQYRPNSNTDLMGATSETPTLTPQQPKVTQSLPDM